MSLERIATVLRTWVGMEPTAPGEVAFGATVEREMKQRGFDSVVAYAAAVEERGEVAESLANRLLVHETWIFRYPRSFEFLGHVARQRRHERRLPLRVLCAPCSTGEEAASIAITLMDAGYTRDDVVLDAFDVSDKAVETARVGRYPAYSFRGSDPTSRPDHFEPVGDAFQLAHSTRDWIRYGVGNVLSPHHLEPGVQYDVVFCRNLLIYLTSDARQQVISALDRLLAPDGLLFLGHAEVVSVASAGFAALDQKDAFVCARAPTPAARPAVRVATRPPAPKSPPVSRPRPTPRPVAPTPASSETELGTARALADAGRLDDALSALDRDIERGHLSADHFHLIAVIHRAAGRVEDAATALGKALYLDPSHYEALVQSAAIADEQGDAARARRLRSRAARARTTETEA